MSQDLSELPPAYASINSSSNATGQPPAYSNPQNDNIKLNVTEVQGHLALLYAFAEFKAKVDNILGERLAVERFERWCKALEDSDADVDEDTFLDKVLPPVDVLMVWHSYLLNPAWYLEDTKRVPILRSLRRLGVCLADAMPKLSSHLVTYVADSKARLATWTTRTRTDFDPFESATTLTEREVLCPACLIPVTVQLTKADGTGYLQEGFSQPCPSSSCNHSITKESFGVRRILVDLTRNVGDKGTEGFQTYMAGSLFRPGTMYDTTRGELVKRNILASSKLKKPVDDGSQRKWQEAIVKRLGWDLKEMRRAMGEELKGIGEKLLMRIITAYGDDRIFSIDLVGTVLRQGSFISKMQGLNWTTPGFLTGQNELVLHHAIARYHAFLDLMMANPSSMIVPTLDIDLVWHTHQLLARRYKKDCSNLLSKFLDHDDKVEEGRLALSFELTAKSWQDKFGLPYVYCGCPISGETIGQKLTRLVGIQNNLKQQYLSPPDRPGARDATHPSDHNAVYALHTRKQADAGRKERETRYAKGLKKAEKGKGKAEGSVTRMWSGSTSSPHPQPFLVPIPMELLNESSDSPSCVATVSNVVNASDGSGGLLCAVVTWRWFVFSWRSSVRCCRRLWSKV
ncbi:hypothetical protein VKT23_016359 [Stygiomarasmius scandens]|uniref:Uncharacterized protein n=1 Tax=Marasmiellus scandens TaxID=2682957 RepID=A0ABR1IZR2_9AGAR